MDSKVDLEDFSKKCTDFQFRSQSHKDKILKILQILQEKLHPQLPDKDLDLVLNCLRCLRNVVAGVEQNQTFLGQNIFSQDAVNTLKILLSSSEKQSENSQCLKLVLKIWIMATPHVDVYAIAA